MCAKSCININETHLSQMKMSPVQQPGESQKIPAVYKNNKRKNFGLLPKS